MIVNPSTPLVPQVNKLYGLRKNKKQKELVVFLAASGVGKTAFNSDGSIKEEYKKHLVDVYA